MERLDVADGFDVHDYRDGLKVLEQDRDRTYLGNRAGYACPACDRPFERLLVAELSELTFSSAPEDPICVVRAPDRLLVLTH